MSCTIRSNFFAKAKYIILALLLESIMTVIGSNNKLT